MAATLTRSPDSDIKIKVWLPIAGWNGKFEAVGNGGWAGTISYLTGKAPDSMVTSHLSNGKVERTRPLCPYPQVATYVGTGSTDTAENFTCRLP